MLLIQKLQCIIDHSASVRSTFTVLVCQKIKINNGKLPTNGRCQSEDLIPEEDDPDHLLCSTVLSYV